VIPRTLVTERLVLRPPVIDDALAIFEEYAQDPAVSKYLAWRPHSDVGGVRAVLERQVDGVHSGTLRVWVICVKPSDRAVGEIGFHVQGHSIGIGYTLSRRYWSQGYMTEALRPLIAAALADPAIFRVWALCDREHTASARVLEKVGMQFEGILRRWCVLPNLGSTPRDCACYSAVKASAGDV
jgi:RimJ/RimL family protein N-acetyltransferase